MQISIQKNLKPSLKDVLHPAASCKPFKKCLQVLQKEH